MPGEWGIPPGAPAYLALLPGPGTHILLRTTLPHLALELLYFFLQVLDLLREFQQQEKSAALR